MVLQSLRHRETELWFLTGVKRMLGLIRKQSLSLNTEEAILSLHFE